MMTLKQEAITKDSELMQKLAMKKEEREKSVNEICLKYRSDLALHAYDDLKLKKEMFVKKYDIPLRLISNQLFAHRWRKKTQMT